MSKASKLRQRELRPASRAAGGAGWVGSPSSQRGHVVVVELLAPQHAGERLAHHRRLVRRPVGRGQLGVELVGLGGAGRQTRVELPAERRGRLRAPGPPGAAAAAARPWRRPPPRAWYQKAHLVPTRSGLTVAAPWTTWSLIPSFGYGVARVGAVQALVVGLVLAEQQRSARCRPAPVPADQLEVAEERVVDADRRRRRPPPGPAWGRRGPTTRCCGTTPSAARAACRRPARRW